MSSGSSAPDRHERLPAAGSVADEYRAMRDACGLIERSWVAGLEIRGADRVRFLNGFVTCDVRSLAPGHGTYGFVTQIKGRVISDLVVLALADRLWIELPARTGEEIAAHLRKYVIADQVGIEPLEGMLALTLIGPRVLEVLGAVEPLPVEPYGHRRVSLSGHEVLLLREPELRVPVWTLWTTASMAAALSEELLKRGEAQGLRAVGRRAFEILRVEAGRPLFGQDFGPENFPQELAPGQAVPAAAVSYTKGCYLGQEVVARIRHRGGVRRLLRGLVFAPGISDPTGKQILCDDREAGVVTSAADSPSCGRILGLSILHERAAEPGGKVGVEGGGEAEVAELPFDLP